MTSKQSPCTADRCDCPGFDANPFVPSKCKCQHSEKDHKGSTTQSSVISPRAAHARFPSSGTIPSPTSTSTSTLSNPIRAVSPPPQTNTSNPTRLPRPITTATTPSATPSTTATSPIVPSSSNKPPAITPRSTIASTGITSTTTTTNHNTQAKPTPPPKVVPTTRIGRSTSVGQASESPHSPNPLPDRKHSPPKAAPHIPVIHENPPSSPSLTESASKSPDSARTKPPLPTSQPPPSPGSVSQKFSSGISSQDAMETALYSSVLAPAFFGGSVGVGVGGDESFVQTRQRKISMANPVRASVAHLPLGSMIPQGSHQTSLQKNRQSLHASVDGDISISSIIRHGLVAAKLNTEHIEVIMNYITSLKSKESPLLDRHQLRSLLQIYYKVQVLVGQQDLNRALIFLQSMVRMKRDYRRYAAFKSSDSYKRNKFIQGLYIDEMKYFKKLQTGFKTYYTELMVVAGSNVGIKGQLPTAADVKAIFGNFDILYSCHQELLHSFEAMMVNWPFSECMIGKLFRKRAQFLKYYGDYVSNFHFSSETMKRLDENERYCSIINSIESKGQTFGLQAILSFPLNRIPVYENSLENILQYTPKTHPDHNDLFEVLAIVRQTVPIIKDKLEHSTERSVILEIYRRLQKSHGILSEKSKFIREGDCNEAKPKVGPRTLFLFNDRLVISKPQPRGYCKFRQSVLIAHVKAKDISDSNFGKNLIEITGADSEIISFSTAEEKKSWLSNFEALARELADSRVFGASLESLLKREPGAKLPTVLVSHIEFIRKAGMDSVGIFRLSGDMSVVEEIRRLWDEGTPVDFDQYDVNAVASSIKLWFRLLPEPVFTFALYESLCGFGDVKKEEKERLAYLQPIIQKIPPANCEIIKYLFTFLEEVSRLSGTNRMDSANLSTVFGPNLIKPKEITIENALDIPRVNETICFMIENRSKLFTK